MDGTSMDECKKNFHEKNEQDDGDGKRVLELEHDKQQTTDKDGCCHLDLQTKNLFLQCEMQKISRRLRGLDGLVRQLDDSKKKCRALTDKYERLEGTLARAENRIAQLSIIRQNENESQAHAYQGAIVTPGISRKILDGVIKENSSLKQSLEHLTKNGPTGVDFAVENRHLHETIMTMRDERELKDKEMNELKALLTNFQDGHVEATKDQVVRLAQQVTKLERRLGAKQVFCEAIVTENETLKKNLQSMEDDKMIVSVRDAKMTLGRLVENQPDIRDIMTKVWDEEDETAKKDRQELEEKMEALSIELRDATRERDRLEKDLEQARYAIDTQRQELQDDLATVTRERDDLKARFDEVQSEWQLMQDTLVTYANDFKVERQERLKAVRDRDAVKEKCNHLLELCNTPPPPPITTTTNRSDANEQGNDFDGAAPGRTSSQRNMLQCPECKGIFPYYLVEDHIKDCSK